MALLKEQNSVSQTQPVDSSLSPQGKRVLFVNHTAALGGGEVALFNLLEELDKSRFTPIALLFEEGPLAAKLRSLIETHVIPLKPAIANTRKDSLGFNSLFEIGTIWNVIRFIGFVTRFIRQRAIDLVHTNSLKADIIGGISSRIAGRPVIWHVRDRISSDYLPKPVVVTFRILARLIPTHVIAISHAVLQTLGQHYETGAQSKKATVVHDGIRLYDPLPPTGRNHPAVGLIGRISPWKGQHIFVRAAALVRKRHPTVRFRIIGAALFGEQEYERKLYSLTAELGMRDAVEFTGFRNDIPACIADLDIVVHASTTGEPFGQVILEGMAAAKAVVATAGGGVPEIINDRVDGLLVPMNDASELAAAISWLLENPTQAAILGSNARYKVETTFGIARVALNVGMVFSKVLNDE